jgi:hypothetical protein
MYEHRSHRLLSPAEFFKRVVRHGLVALAVMGAGLGLGVSDTITWRVCSGSIHC